ncbi:MAG: MmcQ/YjbR family DNA-binding protein [Burkholderiales bacterium]|nr:MmcQ/YjbR family DNA-binding protein [Burkholderiales bacterium]
MTVSFEQLCEMALRLPGVERGTSYGTPALKVAGKLMVRLKEDGGAIVLHADWETREWLLTVSPEVFFFTEHYRNHPYMLARLDKLDAESLPAHLERCWRQVAPKRLLANYPNSAN